MSTTSRVVAAVGLAIFVTACDRTPQEEFVVAEPDTITIEPSYTGKY